MMTSTKTTGSAKDPEALSWLKLGDVEPTPELQKVYDTTTARIGYVRNSQIAMAATPDVVIALDGLSRALMKDDANSLSPKERELIALVASVENNCVSCIFSHAARLRAITGDPIWTAVVEANYRHADLTPRERAMADYAWKLTAQPSRIDEDDLAPLRGQGISEIDIFYIIAIASYFNLSNRVMSGLGMKPNAEAYNANR